MNTYIHLFKPVIVTTSYDNYDGNKLLTTKSRASAVFSHDDRTKLGEKRCINIFFFFRVV